ncbi:hypothetical protein AB3R30_22105 [Leptolyngbyaceae cyanobacterium UHCC 1019]
MTIAQHFPTSTIKRPSFLALGRDRLLKFVNLLGLFATKLWWHGKAYSVIFMIIGLTVLSLAYLWIETTSRKWAIGWMAKDRSKRQNLPTY